MPDSIVAKAGAARFAPHPEGTFGMVCVDVVDLGERVEQYQQNPPRVVNKCAIVFYSDELNDEGQPFSVSAEFTVSMNERAGLRHLLEQWRGKSYTEDQAREGVPVHKLVGQPALVTVEHKTSGQGRTYAKIRSISPLPKGMAKPTVPEYERAEFWAERKAEYAAGVAKMRGVPAQGDADDSDFPPPHGDDDDMPF